MQCDCVSTFMKHASHLELHCNHKPLLKIDILLSLAHKYKNTNLILQIHYESPTPPPSTNDKNEATKYQYLLTILSNEL